MFADFLLPLPWPPKIQHPKIGPGLSSSLLVFLVFARTKNPVFLADQRSLLEQTQYLSFKPVKNDNARHETTKLVVQRIAAHV